MDVALDHIEDIALNIKTFWFRPEHKVGYTAGQFTEMHVPHAKPDDRGQKRWFTLSSSPTEELLSITTKFVPQKSSTFKQALRALQPGYPLRLADPMGDFVLPKQGEIPLVFIGGGMGITPFRSMIKCLADTGEKRQIQFIYAVNSVEDIAFQQLFEGYVQHMIYVVSEPPANWDGESGRLTGRRIIDLANGLSHKRVYVSGPEPMVENLVTQLEEAGVDKQSLVTDYFPGYLPI